MADDLEAALERERQVAEARERREHALADAEEMRAQVRQRQAEAPVSSWTPPTTEPTKPRAQPQPKPRAEMAPPEASKVTIPMHGPDGRIVSISEFSGASLSTGLMWEKWVKAEIKAALDRRLYDEIWKQLHVFAKAWGEDEAKDWHAAHDRFAEIERRLERVAALEERLKQLETRAAAGPRLVQEAPDAAAD
jgi:hypothetical protein